jgi:hypothetical protein
MGIEKQKCSLLAPILFGIGIISTFVNGLLVSGFMAGMLAGLPFFAVAIIARYRSMNREPGSVVSAAPIIGAGTGVFIAVLIPMSMAIKGNLSGWPGGADIGMGVAYVALPIIALLFGAIGSGVALLIAKAIAKK